jgi:hypothetical protein
MRIAVFSSMCLTAPHADGEGEGFLPRVLCAPELLAEVIVLACGDMSRALCTRREYAHVLDMSGVCDHWQVCSDMLANLIQHQQVIANKVLCMSLP